MRDCAASSKSVVVQVASYVYAGKDGQTLDLGVLGTLADQVHSCASQCTTGKKLHLVFSGHLGASQKACKALSQLLSLKDADLDVSCQAVEIDSQVALATAQSLDASLLIYLSHAPGIANPNAGKGKVLSVYQPPSPGEESTCQPGQSVIQSAWAAAQSGVSVILASAKEANVVGKAVAGEEVGTLFDTQAAAAAAAQAEQNAASGGGVGGGVSACKDMALRARAASRVLQSMPSEARVAMLERVAAALEANVEKIMEENAKDVADSQGKVADSLLQRLILKPAKITQLAAGIRAIAQQDEPIGQLLRRMEIAEGLVLDKITAPIGVLLIIFEARPDALPQIAALALRSGNGLLLKGGKEATHSNAVLHHLIVQAIGPELGPDLIGLVTTRGEINDLLELDHVIDLVIPRGGNALVSFIQRNTRIPVLGHADGICHAYVDAAADLDMAMKVVVDGKVDYPAACNAIEKVLVHSHWLSHPTAEDGSGLAAICAALKEAGVTVHTQSQRVRDVCGDLPPPPSARHEYSSLDITLEVVDNMQEAIDHIHANGSSHTEVVVTQDQEVADKFLAGVDAACVFHNASTRFSDGFRFGLGAEVGISTSRIHARGPVGVEGLLTTKWLMRGKGQIVAKDTGITYTHHRLPLASPQ